MSGAPLRFWSRWLTGVAAGTGAFGLSMVLAPAAIEALFATIVAPVMPTGDAFAADPRRYVRFVCGVLGATMVGWSVLLAVVARGPFARGERWAWTALAASVGSWYLLDSTWSLLSGFWPNALFNTGFALLLAPPLIATRAGLRPRPR